MGIQEHVQGIRLQGLRGLSSLFGFLWLRLKTSGGFRAYLCFFSCVFAPVPVQNESYKCA